MPVTAKLSQRFYEKLGDDVANELVEWFNSVDLAYRSDLRELNERNFSRFDAKLEQRIAELRAEFRTTLVLEHEGLRKEINEGLTDVRKELAGLRLDMSAMRADIIKWTFVFFVTAVLAVIGLR